MLLGGRAPDGREYRLIARRYDRGDLCMSVELRGPDVTGEACGGFNYRDRPSRPAFAPIINDQTCADSWVYGSTPTGVASVEATFAKGPRSVLTRSPPALARLPFRGRVFVVAAPGRQTVTAVTARAPDGRVVERNRRGLIDSISICRE